MSGLYSLEQHDWWPAALDICHLHSDQLPRLVSVGSVASYTDRGGSRSPTWVRLLAEALDVPLTVTEADPLRGAARMALPSALRPTD
ncbi:MAG: hypothetical protein ABIK89_16035 [Planctomycetota bacterium]